ncbi:MAG: hypothetical protein KBT48_00810 [Firmicutes bacterium]|nr:hypothetical protein [Bacillota bacterium]
MEDVLLAGVFFWMCIALFTINVITWKSLSRQVQFPIIKGILEKGAIFNILAAYASLNPIFDGAGSAILFGILGFLFIGALYLIGKGRKPKKNSKTYRSYGFESYEAIDYMDEATLEYLEYCGKEDIDEEDDEKIYAYASAPILYWLARLKDNGYLVDIEIDEESPLNLFVRMNYVLRKENIKPEIMTFMNYYYFNGEVRKSAFHQPSYIVDYYNLVREENSYFYIHEFSYEVYSRFAKTIDQRYQNFQINMMEAEVYKDIEDIDFEINTFGEIDASYIRKCVESYRNLSSAQKERMREALNEYVEDDEINSLAHFSMDEMVIFQPRGEEIAYILCGEADFEEEHGISICMVNGIVTEVAYRMDYMNPWAFKDMEKYKAYQRGLKIPQAQDKEQMGYLIQSEDFTWTYLTVK